MEFEELKRVRTQKIGIVNSDDSDGSNGNY